MNIRTITASFNLEKNVDESIFKHVAELISEVKKSLKDFGIVRTTRFCSQPLNEIKGLKPIEIENFVKRIDHFCHQNKIDWFCLPLGTYADENNDLKLIDSLPEIMKNSKIAFSNVIVGKNKKINILAIKECARQIKNISKLTKTGFDNFKFCVSANVEPNGAFFPYSWHDGEDGFSIGTEIIDAILKFIQPNNTLENTRKKILEGLSDIFVKIDEIAKELENRMGVKYYGLDLSLAPYPLESQSVGKALELLGVDAFGANGTLFLTAFLTDTLKQIEKNKTIRTIGFSGVMYPILEDIYLSRRNDSENFNIDSLLSYSSVCGCGPDMIPLPEDISEEEIASIILDTTSLAFMLDKPLVARLVPIPGKKVGEKTEFDYDFFNNTKIMKIKNLSAKKLLENNESFRFLG